MNEKPTTPRRPKAMQRLAWTIASLSVLLLGVRLALPATLNHWLTNIFSEELNLDATIGDIDIDLFRGHVFLTDIETRLEGKKLASARTADVHLNLYELIVSQRGTISIELHEMVGEIHVEKGGALNVSKVGPSGNTPSTPPDMTPPAVDADRIYIDVQADNAQLTIHDKSSDPAKPLSLPLPQVWIRVTKILISGPDLGADLMDVGILGSIGRRSEPALFSAGYWEGLEPKGTYLELHAAFTGLDIRGIPQWVNPHAGRILGGDVLNVSVTTLAHKSMIDKGVIELEVVKSKHTFELLFGGPLDAPVFDKSSQVLQAFRLGFLRVVDSGSSLLSQAGSIGESLWNRTSGVFTHTATGVSDAITEHSIRKLGEGVWEGISGLFRGSPKDDKEDLKEKWTRMAQRQLEFRKLYMERRLAVAKELNPKRVPYFEQQLKDTAWAEEVHQLIPKEALHPDHEEKPQS
jgi:hypothetical protein